jgi:hypothetical protein
MQVRILPGAGTSYHAPAMTSANDPPPPAARWVSFAEAQKILGLTEGTLRRAIKAGTVQGEQRRRNPDSPSDQRMVYEVLVVDTPGAAAAVAAPIEAASATEPATIAPDATMRALELLETLLRANGETMERQAVKIEALQGLLWQAEHDKAVAEARAELLTDARDQFAIDYSEQLERAIKAEALAESLAVERAQAKLEVDELRERLDQLNARPWWRKVWG